MKNHRRIKFLVYFHLMLKFNYDVTRDRVRRTKIYIITVWYKKSKGSFEIKDFLLYFA